MGPSYLRHNIKSPQWGYKVGEDDGREDEGKSDLKAKGISVTNLRTNRTVNVDQ